MPKKTFTKDELLGLEFPWVNVNDEIVDTTRWGIIHDTVIESEGKFYLIRWEDGATEYQDYTSYEDGAEGTEVEEVWVSVQKWAPVED